MITIVVPAWNEEACIGSCLEAVAGQRDWPAMAGKVELIVAANGCTDGTVAVAEAFRPKFELAGVAYRVLDLPPVGKAGAIRTAERMAAWPARAVLDADTILGPESLSALLRAIDTPEAVFVAGRLELPESRSRVTRAYGRALMQLPYFGSGRTGAGFYAVSAAGRARWDEQPELIADDMFVRGHFAADEMRVTDQPYHWPLPDGWQAIVRVRRRQEVGLRELERHRPDLLHRGGRRGATFRAMVGLALREPLTMLVYMGLIAHARLTARVAQRAWERGR